ncbi:MAG: IS1634 family transposase [Planctomycetes bacterium]|nr:IS1634 family transposase [Planctomycetota bacterium]
MFLRRYERRKSGKRHTYWALVESIRTDRGSRQRVVAYLGELKKSEQNGWAVLGRRLDRKDRPQPSLFDPPAYPEPDDTEPVLVKLKGIRLERSRDFGDVWLALGLWRLVGLDELLSGLMPSGREEVPWATVAAILTLARFCEPSSELHIEETWYRRTSLEDLLGVSVDQVYTDRLYAGLDQLLPHKEAIEAHLKRRLGDLFDLKYDLLLYDVTSTYFEGECLGNPMAQRGYSRDSRPDCPQVCIGLVVTTDGIPLGYEVFDGNTNDSTTVEAIVEAMEGKYGRANRVWVMDRGMVSEANLKFLRDRGGSYIVGTPKAMLRQFERYLTSRDWHEVQAGVEVKLVPGPDGAETFVLARSHDRREKEKAMHQRFLERMEAGLKRMQVSAECGRLKDAGVANRRLGRLQGQYWRAAAAFDVKIEPIRRPTGKARLSITWTRDPRWAEWVALSEGCYLLRTNLADTDPATLWKRYIQLTEAEWAFRITKDELVIRPIWHQKKDRVLAHILICFLAYVLWKALSQWMRAGGLGEAPRTLVQEFAKIKSGDVVLPTRTADGRAGKTVRVRCVTTPDPAQKVLLNRLGLTMPQRLRYLEEVEQM